MRTIDGCIVIAPPDGAAVSGAAGAPTLVKATGSETANLIEVFEQVAAVGAGPPMHIHHECSESIFVIEGELRFQLGADTADVLGGTYVFVPQGVAHTYLNVGTTEGRILFWFTPAARMASYFTELAATHDLDSRTLDEIAARHGVEIVR